MSGSGGREAGCPEPASLFDSEPCGHVVTDRDGRIVRVNATLLAMTGYHHDDLVGRRRFDELLTPGGRIYHETHLRPLLLLQGHLREVAVDLVCSDGRRLPVLLNSVLHHDANGAPSFAQTVLFDATERHSYERELVVANRRIERLQRVTAAFASILDSAHVARTALTELVDGVKADHGLLALLSPQGDELRSVDAVGVPAAPAEAWRCLPLSGAGQLERAVESGEPVFVEGGDGSDEGVPPITAPDARASRFAALPLVVDGRVVGMLCLSSSSLSEFKADERVFLVSFARLCAQAIQRGRLHEASEVAARRARFVSDLGHALDEKIGFAERAQTLVDRLVPEFADFATVEIPARGSRPVAAQHRDAELVGPLLDLRENANVGADKPHSMARARATGEPQLLPDIPKGLYEAYGQDERQLALLQRLSPRSYLGLPLQARGEIVGSLMLVMTTSSRRFGEEDLPFFVGIADRAGVALENARLFEHEHSVAHRLQMSLLPASLPEDPRIQVCARYRPSLDLMEIGGDWYDAFLLPGDRLGFAVGDVVGHHVEAATVMGQLRTALRAFALDGGGPGSAVSRLSRFSLSVPDALCTTVAYAELDLDTRRLTYACAGHLPPLLLAPDAAPRALWEGRSPPLGATPEEPAPQATIALQDGATVLLVTDGLIERRGRSLDDSLQELLDRLGSYGAAPPADFLDDLVSSLFDGVEQIDDVCMLAVSLQRTRSHPESPAPRERGLETDPGVAPPPQEALAS